MTSYANYIYVGSNPTVNIDPSGLYKITKPGGRIPDKPFGPAISREFCGSTGCCTPAKSHQVEGRSWFVLQPEDPKGWVFYQEVANKVSFRCGAKCHPEYGLAACIPCTQFSIKVDEQFVEGFNPYHPRGGENNGAGGFFFARDGHVANPAPMSDLLDKACSDGCDWCCEWEFKKVTTKKLTFAAPVLGMNLRNDVAWRSANSFVVSPSDCAGCHAQPYDSYKNELTSISYPSGHTFVAGLALPPGRVFTRADTVIITHPARANHVIQSHQSTGYA